MTYRQGKFYMVHISVRIKYLLNIYNMLVENGEYLYIKVLAPDFQEFII